MIRIIKIAIEDILNDAGSCSARINRACRRNQPMQVSGICSNAEILYVILEERISVPCQYRVAPLAEFDDDAIIASVRSRFDAGFTTVGSFIASETLWALFSRPLRGVR